MRTTISSHSAMTLTELLVASVLVGIVTLGLISAEYTIRTSRLSSVRDSQISAQLQAAMIRLSRDANLTVGDPANSGIREFPAGSDRTVCFREALAGGIDSTYSNSVWNCWWREELAAGRSNLTSCSYTSPTAPQSNCAGAGVANVKFWVRLSNDPPADPEFYTIVPNASGQFDHIELDLISRFDLSAPAHAISNPEYHLSSQINPQSQSR